MKYVTVMRSVVVPLIFLITCFNITACSHTYHAQYASRLQTVGENVAIKITLFNDGKSYSPLPPPANTGNILLNKYHVLLHSDGSSDLMLQQVAIKLLETNGAYATSPNPSTNIENMAGHVISGIMQVGGSLDAFPIVLSKYIQTESQDRLIAIEVLQRLASGKECEFSGYSQEIGRFRGCFTLTVKARDMVLDALRSAGVSK